MNNRKGNNPELGILRKGSYSDLTRSKEFETNNNSTKFSKRETNTSNYKQISDLSLFDNNNKTALKNINLTNRNNLRIDPINIERDNVNNVTKNYSNNTNQINAFKNSPKQINAFKSSPKPPNKISTINMKKIGFSETNNSKFFNKIN